MNLRAFRPVYRYVAVVCLVGITVLVILLADGWGRAVGSAPGGFAVFSLFVLIGELFPIRIPRRDEVDEITTSTTFAFALMLAYGTTAAALPLAVASAVSDVLRRKPIWKTTFNVAQYTLAIAAAGWTYSALGGAHRLSAEHIPAFMVSAAAFFLLNGALTDTALALAQGLPVLRYLSRDFIFQAYTAPALLALTPLLVVAADRTLWLVPLLAVPIAAVYWGAVVSLENSRLVARLEGSLAHMTELNRVKDEFVAVVSHELRTPLTSIQGSIKTLIRLSSELSEEERMSFLQAAGRQSDRLGELIEQLLVIARLESHVEPVAVAPVSIREVVDRVVSELRPSVRDHRFELTVDPTMRPAITDEQKVHRILSNLVENALKYSPPGTRIAVRVEETDQGVLVFVEDEGPGIPPEAHKRVFERFYQVDQSSTRRVGGAGLGLYICRKMADAIGARVWLDRSTNEGSVFCLLLPDMPALDPAGDGEPSLDEGALSRPLPLIPLSR